MSTTISNEEHGGLSDIPNLFTEQQKWALVLCPYLSCVLSILGSLSIFYVLLNKKQQQEERYRQNGPFQRLMIGLTSLNLIASLNFLIMQGWGVPETPWASGMAIGTQTTCHIMGFFFTLSLGAMPYTASLSIWHCYIILVNNNIATRAKRAKRRQQEAQTQHDQPQQQQRQRRLKPHEWFAQRLEPWMHASSTLITTTVALYAIRVRYMNSLNLYPGLCYVGDSPPDCVRRDDIECSDHGDGNEQVVNWFLSVVLYSVTVLASFVVILVCMVWLYRSVRKLELQLQQTDQQPPTEGQATQTPTSSASSLKLSQRAGVEGLFYILAFALAYSGSFVASALSPHFPSDVSNRNLYFPIVFWSTITQPLQGFFNAFVYFRGRKRRWECFLASPAVKCLAKWFLKDQRSKKKKPPAQQQPGEIDQRPENPHGEDHDEENPEERNNTESAFIDAEEFIVTERDSSVTMLNDQDEPFSPIKSETPCSPLPNTAVGVREARFERLQQFRPSELDAVNLSSGDYGSSALDDENKSARELSAAPPAGFPMSLPMSTSSFDDNNENLMEIFSSEDVSEEVAENEATRRRMLLSGCSSLDDSILLAYNSSLFQEEDDTENQEEHKVSRTHVSASENNAATSVSETADCESDQSKNQFDNGSSSCPADEEPPNAASAQRSALASFDTLKSHTSLTTNMTPHASGALSRNTSAGDQLEEG